MDFFPRVAVAHYLKQCRNNRYLSPYSSGGHTHKIEVPAGCVFLKNLGEHALHAGPLTSGCCGQSLHFLGWCCTSSISAFTSTFPFSLSVQFCVLNLCHVSHVNTPVTGIRGHSEPRTISNQILNSTASAEALFLHKIT